VPDQWEFYPSQVDGMSAFIYVNLSYRDRSPIIHAGYLAWLSIRLRLQREDGLSSQEEYETLCAIEDAFVDRLDDASVETHYVGRNTSQGCRDFYFYSENGLLVEQILGQAMVQFKDYEFDVGHREEPDWSTYCNFLLPSPRDMQLIQNQHVIQALEKSNDRLEVPRAVLHWAYFPDSSKRDIFVHKSKDNGFDLDHNIEPSADNKHWGAVLTRQHPVDYWSIADVTLTLYDLASEFGGVYDGWETPIIANSTDSNLPK
jgi:uncharacterized protein (TIGR01619 family)